MIAKIGATKAQLRSRLPAQLRRCMPLYVACVVLVVLVFNANILRSGSQYGVGNLRAPVPQQQRTDSQPATSTQKPMSQAAPLRSEFPKKIWQTWKVDPLSFEERDRNNAKSWIERNPEYRYEVLTDDNELPFVEYHFGPDGFNRPDIIDFYKNVQATIVKADLMRYMIMYAEGGLYADIDVEDIRPVARFVPDRFSSKDIDMIVGVEIDEPDWKDHPILGPKSRSFCQWTFICKPRLPVMLHLIERIMNWLTDVAQKQGVPISEVVLDFDEIISGTGPSAFTEAIMAQMNEHNGGRDPITWDAFHDMVESKLVDRVLVLTVEAFAAGQGHSDSGVHEARAALVRHHYHASNWPSRHPRYNHPVYGEVERCNWNDECINKWDADVAAFNKMSEDEQKRLIEEKEREREREEEERRRKEEEDRRKEEEDRKRKEEEDRKREEEERKRKEEEDRKREEEERRRKEEEEAQKRKTEDKKEGR